MTVSPSPQLSVVLPVYNAEAYLAQCLDSLLGQSFKDFELLVIDDGSSDKSAELIKSYAKRDARIRPFFNQNNQGLIEVLNRAVELTQGQFIARMDADDWCEPERLALQWAYLQRHPEVAIVGSWIQLFGARSEVWHYRQQDSFIKAMLLFKTNGFPHNSLMARREVFEQYAYNPDFAHIEDTELWVRIMIERPEWQYANLPRVLTHYRIYPQQVSQRYRDLQEEGYRRILQRLLGFLLGRRIEEQEWQLHRGLMLDETVTMPHESTAQWYQILLEAYEKRHRDDYFVIEEKWWCYCQFHGLESLYRETSLLKSQFTFLN